MNDREHQEQAALVQWTYVMAHQGYPELALLFAIPNGGKRERGVALKLQAEGVQSGVPDLFLPVARGAWHGLFIEMKAGKNKPSDTQKEWIRILRDNGFRVEVCWGAAQAARVLANYVGMTEIEFSQTRWG